MKLARKPPRAASVHKQNARTTTPGWTEFVKTYGPLLNPANPTTLRGHLFTGWGEDYQQVKRTSVYNTWCAVRFANKIYLVPGVHTSNRIGYVLTKNPWKTGQEMFEF